MILVRRHGGDLQPCPHHEGTYDVGGRFDAVGDESIRIAHHAGDNLHHRQDDIRRHADAGGHQTWCDGAHEISPGSLLSGPAEE
jgi:hypothetical protein